jgi:hypothetical protein
VWPRGALDEAVPDEASGQITYRLAGAVKRIEVADDLGCRLGEAERADAREHASREAVGGIGMFLEQAADVRGAAVVVRLEAVEEALRFIDRVAVAGEEVPRGEGAEAPD